VRLLRSARRTYARAAQRRERALRRALRAGVAPPPAALFIELWTDGQVVADVARHAGGAAILRRLVLRPPPVPADASRAHAQARCRPPSPWRAAP
jgi:hypothetical protein